MVKKRAPSIQKERCVVCGEERYTSEMGYAFELRVCSTCTSGDANEALGARGCTCEETPGSGPAPTYPHSIVARFPKPHPITVSFSRETFKHKFSKLFKKEIQVGVQVFDDLVFIATNTTRTTAQFLKDDQDGVLAAILTVIRSGATIQMQDDTIELNVDPRELSPEQDEALRTFQQQLLRTPFAVLIAYLNQYCEKHADGALLEHRV